MLNHDAEWNEVLASVRELAAHELASFSADSLDFRAAANAAVDLARRPIKLKVLRRIYGSGEFNALSRPIMEASIMDVFELHSPNISEAINNVRNSSNRAPGLRARLFAEFCHRLSRDSRFQIILLEYIEKASQWRELLGKEYKSVGSWLRAAAQKFFDARNPLPRTVAAVIFTGISLIVAFRTIPISIKTPDIATVRVGLQLVQPSDSFAVKLNLSSISLPIPVKLASADPVALEFRSKGPVKVGVVADGPIDVPPPGGGADLSTVVNKLGILDQEIAGSSASLLTGTSPQSPNLISALDNVSASVGKLISDDDWKAADLRTRTFQGLVSSAQPPASISVLENGTGTVFLQWLDEQQEPASCLVTAKVAPVKGSRSLFTVGLSAEECSPESLEASDEGRAAAKQLGLNRPVRVSKKIPFHVVILSVDQPLFGKSRVFLRFQQDVIKPKLEPATTANVNSSVQQIAHAN